MPISLLGLAIAVTASPSDAPGARLKLSVTAGNCSWCMMASGARDLRDAQRTCVPLDDCSGDVCAPTSDAGRRT